MSDLSNVRRLKRRSQDAKTQRTGNSWPTVFLTVGFSVWVQSLGAYGSGFRVPMARAGDMSIKVRLSLQGTCMASTANPQKINLQLLGVPPSTL